MEPTVEPGVTRHRSVLRLLLGGACVVVLVAGARAAVSILNPVLLAAFFALLFTPLLHALTHRGWPRWLALTAVLVGVIGSALVFIAFIGVSLRQLATEIPDYTRGLSEQTAALVHELEARGIRLSGAGGVLGADDFARVAVWLVGNTVSVLTSTGLMIFIFAFLLADAPGMEARIRSTRAAASGFVDRFTSYRKTIGRFMALRAVLGLVAAAADLVLLLVVGVDFALLWGVLSFVLSFIPNIGYLLSLIPPVVMGFIQFGVRGALTVLVGYGIINNVVDNVIAPRFIGKGLNLSSVTSFVSVIFWGWVLGGIGAVLAVPLTLFLQRVVLAGYEDTRTLAVALSASPPDGGEASAAPPPPEEPP